MKAKSIFSISIGRYPTARFQGKWAPPGAAPDADKMTLFIDVAYRPEDGSIWAIFISGGKDGTGLKSWMEETGIFLSKALQRGADAKALLKTVTGGDEGLGCFALRTVLEGEDNA